MTIQAQRAQIVLKAKRDVSVRRFHPWIFSGAVERIDGAVAPGDLVTVLSHQGDQLGTGHYGEGSIAVKVISFGDTEPDASFWERSFENAFGLRKRLGLANSSDTTAYRVIHGEGDGLPGLIVDRYNDTFVADLQSPGMERSRDSIEAAITNIFGKESKIVFRSNQAVEARPALIETVRENGLLFFVDVQTGQKTGFFLDQRDNRLLCRRYASGRRVLNAFSYTGAFSVYALAGGAASVRSVDSSKPALELLQKNIELNFPQANATAESADCFDYLTTLRGGFDLIVVDPPAFAKHQKALERGLRGYESINFQAIRAIEPGGFLFTFSCSQLVSREKFRQIVFQAATRARRPIRVLHELSQGADHPTNLFHAEGTYLKGLVLEVA